MTRLRLAFFLGCVLPLALPCSAGTIVQRHGAATLEVRFEGDQPRLALSDAIAVTLTIEGKPTEEITAPREFPPAAKWLVVEPPRTKQETLAGGRIRWQRQYRCAPREPGEKVPFLFPAIQIREQDGEAVAVVWEPIDFTVTTRITQPDRGTLRDITAIETEPPTPPEAGAAWLWWLPACLLALLAGSIWTLRRLLRRKSSRSPRERALYEWRRLQAMQLPRRGNGERFVTLLTLLLREFLERARRLPARRQTTREFLLDLAERGSLTAEEKRFLTEFMQRAEEIKFAHVAIASEECQAWAERVRDFLERSGEATRKESGQAHENLPIEKSGESG